MLHDHTLLIWTNLNCREESAPLCSPSRPGDTDNNSGPPPHSQSISVAAHGKIYLHTLLTSPASSLSLTSLLSSTSSNGSDSSAGFPFDPCHVLDATIVPHDPPIGEYHAMSCSQGTTSDSPCTPLTLSEQGCSTGPASASTKSTLSSADSPPSSGDETLHPCISSDLLSPSHHELCLPPWLHSGCSVDHSHPSFHLDAGHRPCDHHGPCPAHSSDEQHCQPKGHQNTGTSAPCPSSRGEGR